MSNYAERIRELRVKIARLDDEIGVAEFRADFRGGSELEAERCAEYSRDARGYNSERRALMAQLEAVQAELAAAVQRAGEAETTLAAMHTEHGRLYVKWENAMITLRAERQRREAAEAALAAVPVGALLRHIAHAQARGYPGAFADMAAITAWADAQPEVQP